MFEFIKSVDPEAIQILTGELERQQNYLILIPSENYASRAVLEAQGSLMSNKYAEGYPNARYYNGCQFMDQVESLAISRVKKLFGVEHANVQAHSGAQANMAAYYATLEPGDVILSMDLNHGGHLSHGLSRNFSGRYYKIFSYGVQRETGVIDMDEVEKIALKCQPKLIIVGASAYPRSLDFARFRAIADKVGSLLLADIAHIAGLIVADAHPDPAPYCDVITSTTHKTLRGPRGGLILCKESWAKEIDRAVFPGIQGGPFMHSIAAKAVCFKEAMSQEFKEYQAQIVKNAKTLASTLTESNFKLISGGTDNHLMLVDLTIMKLTGKEAANLLEEAGIIVNKNLIPFDEKSPFITSGIRLGTPAITSRGMKEAEMERISHLIAQVLQNPKQPNIREVVKKEVLEICKAFPIYA